MKIEEKVIDTIGTLQLIDTGRRCSVRDVRILRVHCTKGCSDDTIMHDAIVGAFWQTTKMLRGYHQGCDPKSVLNKDPVEAKLQHDANRSILEARPVGACVACDGLDCTGAENLS